MESGLFPVVRFRGRLRPSQDDVVRIARRKLAEGKRRLHIVAPPGSGKTVLGLYLWAEHLQCPALVLSPNSAIQAQWAAQVDLFDSGASRNELVSTRSDRPALLNSLTYQSVTLPARSTESLDQQAIERWQDKLIEANQAKDPAEAFVWIEDLRHRNPDYFQERLATYRKDVRDEAASTGQALDLLHASSLAALRRLRDLPVGLIILDECHHLIGHWRWPLAMPCWLRCPRQS